MDGSTDGYDAGSAARLATITRAACTTDP